MEQEKEQVSVVFNDLPEDCISTILSFTSPRDVCRSSVVSSIFKSASEWDEVWEKFLPPDYHEIISRSLSSISRFPTHSKKKLYFHLSDGPILIDDGKKSFQIEKSTGKKCFMIAARELDIALGDNLRSWRWRRAFSASRFAEVAFRNHVCRLEIRGKIDMGTLSRNTTYAAYLVFNTNNPKGLDYDATVASVRFLGGGRGKCSGERAVQFYFPPRNRSSKVHRSVKRMDGWMEIELGDFFIGDEGGAGEVEMSLKETKSGCTKSGLIVQGIEVRPRGSTLHCSHNVMLTELVASWKLRKLIINRPFG